MVAFSPWTDPYTGTSALYQITSSRFIAECPHCPTLPRINRESVAIFTGDVLLIGRLLTTSNNNPGPMTNLNNLYLKFMARASLAHVLAKLESNFEIAQNL